MLRPFKRSDKDLLLYIFKLNVPEYFAEREIQEFEKYLDENADTYLTLENSGRIAGGVGYIIDKNKRIGQITWIFLHPRFFGKGLGMQAIKHCLELLKEESAVKVIVRTSQFAYGLFEKFGFKVLKTKKDHWGEGLHLYYMEMKLL